MLVPIAVGLLIGLHTAAKGGQPGHAFTWTAASVALLPVVHKSLTHQFRTHDNFWIAQSVAAGGTVIATAASYVGLLLGASVAVGLCELYSNHQAFSATLATCSVVTVLSPAAMSAWRRSGRPMKS